MSAPPLTDFALKKLPAPTGTERVEVWDGKVAGLGVRVSPLGTKSFVLVYRFKRRARRLTLGRYPTLSLGDARQLALEALRSLTHGSDPQQRKEANRSSVRFADVVERFLNTYSARHHRARTQKEVARVLRGEFIPKWGSRDIREINRAHVHAMLDAIISRGAPSAANHDLAVLRKFFNWCVDRSLIEHNPCTGLKKPTKEVSRDRVLCDDELRAIWIAAKQLGYPFGYIVHLLVLTAQRRAEVVSTRWKDIDMEQCAWSITREVAKTGRAHVVPLAPMTMDIIRRMPRLHEHVLFPAVGNSTSTFSGFSKSKRRLDDLSGVANWTLHDLRRTAATSMARLGVAPHVIERVLNHVSGRLGGVAGVYNRFGYLPEMRVALELWGEHVARSCVRGAEIGPSEGFGEVTDPSSTRY